MNSRVLLLVFLLGVGHQVLAAVLRMDGSGTVFPVSQTLLEDYKTSREKPVPVEAVSSTTENGFQRFCRGEIELQQASRPILVEEIDSCRKNSITYFELPVAFDALTVIVSTKNTWLKEVTVDELKKMWEPAAEKVILNWKQVRSDWPEQPLTLTAAEHGSGTFDYFTAAIVEKRRSSRRDYQVQTFPGIVDVVSENPNALGFIPYPVYEANRDKVRAVAIASRPGKKGVLPSWKTVVSAAYSPLSRPMFLYVSSKLADQSNTRALVDFYILNVARVAAKEKYIPLSRDSYLMIQERFSSGQMGSSFGGLDVVGLRLEDLLVRSPAP